ncbi:MAG: hypothetical protein IKP64_02865, partial [Selenomonadaceae bacterium]|nr:hypothetical protein [Selenomonadaceae bacterium]
FHVVTSNSVVRNPCFVESTFFHRGKKVAKKLATARGADTNHISNARAHKSRLCLRISHHAKYRRRPSSVTASVTIAARLFPQ